MDAYDAGIELVNRLEQKVAAYTLAEIRRCSALGGTVARYRRDHLTEMLADEAWIPLAYQLPARTLSDTVFKHAATETHQWLGHTVTNRDTQRQDTIECGRAIEYKAARVNSNGRIKALNKGGSSGVSTEILLLSGDTFADCPVLVLPHKVLAKYASQPKSGGWQLDTNIDAANDIEGLGAYAYSIEEYMEIRRDRCPYRHG